MRTLVVSPVAPANNLQIGGTRTYTLGLLSALREQGEDVWLAGLRGSDQPGFRGVVVSDRDSCSTFRFLLDLFLKLYRCKRLKPDVVNVQLSLAGLPFLLTKHPLVVTMHGSPMQGVAARRGRFAGHVMQLLEGLVLRRAQRVIFVDERARQEYICLYPRLKDKSITIPVAVDTNMFCPPSGPKKSQRLAIGLADKGPVLIFVGRLSREKNVTGLLDAFEMFCQHHHQAVLLLIGDGPEASQLSDYAKDLGLDRNVRFLKGLSRTEIADYLKISDLFVMASLHEGLPIAALEALACGVPLVTTDVGDLNRLVVARITGEVVPDVTALSAAMLSAIGPPEQPGWAKFAAVPCREESLRYSWGSIAEKITAQHSAVAVNSEGKAKG